MWESASLFRAPSFVFWPVMRQKLFVFTRVNSLSQVGNTMLDFQAETGSQMDSFQRRTATVSTDFLKCYNWFYDVLLQRSLDSTLVWCDTVYHISFPLPTKKTQTKSNKEWEDGSSPLFQSLQVVLGCLTVDRPPIHWGVAMVDTSLSGVVVVVVVMMCTTFCLCIWYCIECMVMFCVGLLLTLVDFVLSQQGEIKFYLFQCV